MRVKVKNRKPFTNLALIIILTLIGVIITIIDVAFPILHNPMAEVAKSVFTIITVIAGIWITCYLLFLELFKDRYPFKILKKEYFPAMKRNFLLIIYDMIYGCIVIYFNFYLGGCIYFSTVSLITVILIFHDVFQAHKTLMVNSYVDDFFDVISTKINSASSLIDDQPLNDIKYIFDESLVKEEYHTARNIVSKTGELFRDFLRNSMNIASKTSGDQVDDAFSQIVVFNMQQMEFCKNLQSELLLRSIIKEQRRNLLFCIEQRQYEWFKDYLHEYNLFLFQMLKEENNCLTDYLFGIYYGLISRLIDEEKDEWYKYAIDEIESLTLTYIYTYNKTNIRNYAMLSVNILEYCLEKENEDAYNFTFKKLKKFTKLRCMEGGVFNEIKVYYSYLFSALMKKDSKKARAFFLVINDCRVKCTEDTVLLEFKIHCISELTGAANSQNLYDEELFKYHLDILKEAISLKTEYDGIWVMPDFYGRITEHNCTKEQIDKTIKELMHLLNFCLVKDNIPAFYTLLDELKNSLSKTEKKDKEIQIKLLDVYFTLFYRTIGLVNQQFYEIAFECFRLVVEDLDRRRAISTDLGKKIITNIADCAHRPNEETKKLVNNSIDILHRFLDENEEYYFVSSNVEQKKFLYRCLFNIGTVCIENDYEEGLRRVSNTIGWMAIYSIKQMTPMLTTYLIGRANELFFIAKQMEVSEKTQMFLLTLFTTVGTYCCKDPKYSKFLDCIVGGIKDESVERIKVAVSLRTSENDMWNDLYNNRTKELTHMFVKRFESAKKELGSQRGKKS